MVGMNGIPQPVTPHRLAQRVADLERMVEQLTSSRTYVSVGNIVEGGTIGQAAGAQLTETVQKEIVIERQNLGEAALTDVVVTGSITTRGQTAADPPRAIDVSLTTFARTRGGRLTNNAGIVFQVEGESEEFAPGIYSPNGTALYMETADGAGSTSYFQLGPIAAMVAPEVVVGNVLAPLVHADLKAHKITLGDSGGLFSPGPSTTNLLGNVKVNGRDLSYVPPTLVAPINGFAHYNASGWSGVRYAISNGIVEVTGAYTKASYGSQEVIGVLPLAARPSAKKKGTNVEISAAGEILTAASGSGPTSFGITFIL